MINNNGDVLVWADSYEPTSVSGALLIPYGGVPAWHFADAAGMINIVTHQLAFNDGRRMLFEPSNAGGRSELLLSDGPGLGPGGQPTAALAQRLIGTGDPLAGLIVSSVDISARAGRQINNAGDFVFQASLTDGVSYYEAIVRAKTAPVAPSNLIASASSAFRVVLQWTDNSSGGQNEDRFQIWLSHDGVTFSHRQTVGADTTTWADTSPLVAPPGFTGQQRFYQVRACRSGCSDFTNIATPAAPPAPLARLNLTASPVLSTMAVIRLQWLDPDTLAEHIQINRSSRYYTYSSAAFSEYTDYGVTAGARYCYEIRAFNYGGVSAWSGPVCLDAPEPFTMTTPVAVASLTGAVVSFTTTMPALGTLQFARAPCAAPCAYSQITGGIATSHGFNVTDLVPGTEYVFRAVANVDLVTAEREGTFTTTAFQILNVRVDSTTATTTVVNSETNVPAIVEVAGLPSTARSELQTGGGQVTFTLNVTGLAAGTAYTLVLTARSLPFGPQATAQVQFRILSPNGYLVARVAGRPRIGPVVYSYPASDAGGNTHRVKVKELSFDVTITNTSSNVIFDSIVIRDARVDLPCPPASGLCYETFVTYPREFDSQVPELGRALIVPPAIGSLRPGQESTTATVTFHVDDYVLVGLQGLFGNGGVLHLDVTAAVPTPSGPVPLQEVLDVRVTLPSTADLEITMTAPAGLSRPVPGSTLTFQVMVENHGPLDATGVRVRFGLPAGARFAPPTAPAVGGRRIGSVAERAHASWSIATTSPDYSRFNHSPNTIGRSR